MVSAVVKNSFQDLGRIRVYEFLEIQSNSLVSNKLKRTKVPEYICSCSYLVQVGGKLIMSY